MPLDIRSVSQSIKDKRCLELWFGADVTQADRDALLVAINGVGKVLEQTDVHEATHVRLSSGETERIESKWGIGPEGHLMKPSEGGFGVVTETGKRVDMFAAHSYWRVAP